MVFSVGNKLCCLFYHCRHEKCAGKCCVYYLVLGFGTEILSHFCDSFYKLRVVVEIWFLIVSLEFCHF